jgi:hypothetical protein
VNGCRLCGKDVAYSGAFYCGAGCCARWEGGERPTVDAAKWTVADYEGARHRWYLAHQAEVAARQHFDDVAHALCKGGEVKP